MARDTSFDALTRVHYARQAVASYFQDKWDAAFENARFFRLKQFSDAQLQKMMGQKRVPYVLDYMTNVLNTYLGVQRDTRTDITYRPFEADDELRVELLNVVKDNTLNGNDFIFLESDVFQDGIIEKMGAVGMEWTTEENPLGALRLYRIPPRQLTWDLNRREFLAEEGNWVSRTRLYPKKQLAALRPEYAKQIMNLQLDSGYFDTLPLDPSYFKQIVDYDLGAVALIEFFETDWKDRHFVFNYDAHAFDETVYKTKREAEKAIRDFLRQWEQTIGNTPGIVPPSPPKVDVVTRKYRIVKKTEIIHDMVTTDTEETELQHFPYTLYYPFWHDGEWWALADTFKDPQRYINKMFAMIDHQLGVGSKGLLLGDENIPDDQWKTIVDGWSKAGGAYKVRDPKANVVFIPPTGFDPRLLESMNIALAALQQKAGGANFLGAKEGANEAAAAIHQRIEQGGLGHFLIFDNLSRWKKSLGEKILWYLTTYMKASQKVRIEGRALTALAGEQFPSWLRPSANGDYGFLTVNTESANTIAGLKADIVIDEAKHSTTRNQATLAQLAAIMQSSPMLASTIPPQLLLELVDIPASDRMKWEKWMDQMLSQKMENDKNTATSKPSLSATLEDVKYLPPELQQQFIALFGLQPTNEPIAEDKTGQVEAMRMLNANHMQDKELASKGDKHLDHVNLRLLQLLLDQHKGNAR